MSVIERLLEKYDWAIDLYIMGNIVGTVVVVVVSVIIFYNVFKRAKKSEAEFNKRREEFDKECQERKEWMKKRREKFFKGWDE